MKVFNFVEGRLHEILDKLIPFFAACYDKINVNILF